MIGLPALVSLALGASWTVTMPELRGFNFVGGLTLAPEYFALLIALVTYTSAFIAEIVRSGIQAVPQGQWDAAKALGLRRGFVLQHIVLPQALRVIIPPMTSQYLNLTKNSSLAVAVGYQDIVSIANTTLNQTGQAIEAHRAHHGGVPDHQPRHQPVHELVQRAHRAGGALSAMTSMTDRCRTIRCRSAGARSRRPPGGRVVQWLRANLFASIPQRDHLAAADLPARRRRCVSLVQWGYLNAIWSVPGNDTSACRAIRGLGACWAVIPEKYRFILFGTYPFDQQWRPALASLVFIALFCRVEPAQFLAQGAGAGLGRPRWSLIGAPDVGRRRSGCPSCRRIAGAGCR